MTAARRVRHLHPHPHPAPQFGHHAARAAPPPSPPPPPHPAPTPGQPGHHAACPAPRRAHRRGRRRDRRPRHQRERLGADAVGRGGPLWRGAAPLSPGRARRGAPQRRERPRAHAHSCCSPPSMLQCMLQKQHTTHTRARNSNTCARTGPRHGEQEGHRQRYGSGQVQCIHAGATPAHARLHARARWGRGAAEPSTRANMCALTTRPKPRGCIHSPHPSFSHPPPHPPPDLPQG